MALSTFFTDYLDRLLTICSFDEESKKKLKADLIEAWKERSGQRIEGLLTPEEAQKLSDAINQTGGSAGQAVDDKIRITVFSLISDTKKQEEILAIYAEEAEKILGEMTDTFVQNTDLEKQKELANVLADLEVSSPS